MQRIPVEIPKHRLKRDSASKTPFHVRIRLSTYPGSWKHVLEVTVNRLWKHRLVSASRVYAFIVLARHRADGELAIMIAVKRLNSLWRGPHQRPGTQAAHKSSLPPLQSKQNTMWAESSILTGRISGRKFPFRLVELYSPRGQAQTATRGVFRIACALRGVSELVMGAVVNISYRPTFVQRSLSSPCYASIIVCAS